MHKLKRRAVFAN